MEVVDIEVRKSIIELKKSGEKLTEICQLVSLPYRTVSNIWQRYKKYGLLNLGANYTNCGSLQAQHFKSIKSKCIDFKILHPRWGTPRIHLELKKLYSQNEIPSIRTLHSWYRKANLIKPKHQENAPIIGSAKAVHNIWQIDAKERLIMTDKQKACYLTIVDDKSGACLEALVFPLSSYQSSSDK